MIPQPFNLRIDVRIIMSEEKKSTRSRGRRSIASRILEHLKDESMEEECFLVLYDFSGKISNYFYRNLNLIRDTLGDGVSVQKSAIQCKYARTMRAIEQLAKHYGAEVLIFKVEPLE